MKPQDRAKKSSDALWVNDHASQWMGIERGEVIESGAYIIAMGITFAMGVLSSRLLIRHSRSPAIRATKIRLRRII
jgi:hypothetical protein